MRILHVVEAYGGGVASAVDQYVASTPELEHFLLRKVRSKDFADDGDLEQFAEVRDMGSTLRSAVSSFINARREVLPDVVHAHSSYGGLITRTLARRSRSLRVVYTPHAFATERQDVSSLWRAAYGVVETLLGLNTTVVAACSDREAMLATRFVGRRRVVLVPNVAQPSFVGSRDSSGPSSAPRIVAAGRFSRQKDPAFFGAVAGQLADVALGATYVWLGGEKNSAQYDLASRGVDVTGWIPRTVFLDELARSDVYVHTAVWEGAPMALLEASALGVPIVARRIAALNNAPVEWTATSPESIAALVRKVLASGSARQKNLDDWSSHFADNNAECQRARLFDVYGHAPRAGEPHVRG